MPGNFLIARRFLTPAGAGIPARKARKFCLAAGNPLFMFFSMKIPPQKNVSKSYSWVYCLWP